MELHLGRALEYWEQVDHINDDPSDDRIDNFQILSQAENNLKYITNSGRTAPMYEFVCPMCEEVVSKRLSVVRHNQKQNKSGPYCSKSCAGRSSRLKQLGRME